MQDRHKPVLSVTIYPRQMRTLLQMEQRSGLSRSRIICEMIDRAIRTGYTPGSVSLGEMREEAVASLRTTQT